MILDIFGADPASLPYDLGTLQKGTPPIILFAVPTMIFFTLLEIWVSFKGEKQFYLKNETWGSIFVGLGNLLVSFFINMALILFVVWVWKTLPWRMELNWWTFFPCYVIYDLCSYWAHRISHEKRFWWATHIAHHSGTKYNLAVSFRLSWVQHLKTIFFVPTMLFGFHPFVFFVTNQIAVLFQFWVHTEYIRKLPIIDLIFATPSNHRVHHGCQEQYIDKNYGATFIFWDKIFGTFEPEDEPVVYGLTTNIPKEKMNDPFYINFHEYYEMVNDIKNAPTWKEKWFYFWGSPYQVMLKKKAIEDAKQLETPSVQPTELVA